MNFKPIKLFLLFLFIANLATGQHQFSPEKISKAALELTQQSVVYDGSYYSMPYPNGDVPDGIGVCTDVVIRTYRANGLDLQKEVHEDMLANFDSYPKHWGLKKPDPNIDHRRVPNLMTYFERKGARLPITKNESDYYPGDIVAWDLGGGVTHIGIVVNVLSNDKKRDQIVHNIGAGQVLEDCLFNYKIIGHYRFLSNSTI
ncbi:MAG: DUF1287 domain-containing protein [Flavobacteriaceae bacterium]|jgi:hypothetical protein|tara:strand:+ start:1698 stop:2300 length:603 start_codon:yes stop_codon:yes gene_type:complete